MPPENAVAGVHLGTHCNSVGHAHCTTRTLTQALREATGVESAELSTSKRPVDSTCGGLNNGRPLFVLRGPT